jgi:hypothetical protein
LTYFYNDSIHHQALGKESQEKNKYIYTFSHSYCINFFSIHSWDMFINIEQIFLILCPEKPSADNFSYFSCQNAQNNFLQWSTLLESSNFTSIKRRCMVCFDSGREDRMHACAGRGGRAKCQFS